MSCAAPAQSRSLRVRPRSPRSLGFGLCPWLLLGLLALPTHAAPLHFETDIRPIFKAHCFDCHGEGDHPKGGLDLRLVRTMLLGGDSGPAVKPGHPESSLLFELLHSGEMPKRDRKPTPDEIEKVRSWIAAGAPTLRPEPVRLESGMQITDEERRHWAFQPVRGTPPADPDHDRAARNPIDAFLLRDLRAHGLGFSDPAPRHVQIRRLYLDLWGLPPAPEEVDAFERDPAPDAYERLVDRLLRSPRYGERWARHWLDVAGYADSDGYTNDDPPRPYAYKYRDYVIRALNSGMPFDRFITEQLAGDELALQQRATLEEAVRDPLTQEWVVATGFLRMAADGTSSGQVEADTARNQVIADTLRIVSTSMLGLSVACAQCHDHRYDPIRQTDYYALRAFFEPAYDWKNWRVPSQRLVSLYSTEERKRSAEIEAEAAQLTRERESRQSEFIDDALRKHLEKFDEPLRDALWTAFKTPADKRSEAQQRLLKEHPSANIHPGVLYQYNPKAADELKAMDARIAEVRARKPPEDFVSALWETGGTPPPTRLFHRGDPKQAREEVAPGVPLVLTPAGSRNALDPNCSPAKPGSTSGRRLALARWLTSPANPLLARVWVNRVWMHHFGRGLTGTPADFGVQGERPSHPELLDWLAHAFMAPPGSGAATALNWDLKALHRLIVTSQAYRQSSNFDPQRHAADPENRLYSRWSMLRLDAEAVRDSMLAVSGALTLRMFGPPVPVREDAVGQIVVGIDKKQGDNKMPVEVPMGAEEFRRSIYIEVRRSRPLAILNAFDAPVMEVNCERRQSSTVAPQALLLMNSDFALQQARFLAVRTRAEAGPAADARLARAWRLAFGRDIRTHEQRAALAFLHRQQATLARQPAPPKGEGKDKPTAPADPQDNPQEQAFATLCQALLSSNEFLYVE